MEPEIVLNVQDSPVRESSRRVYEDQIADICVRCKSILRKQIHRSSDLIGLDETIKYF